MCVGGGVRHRQCTLFLLHVKLIKNLYLDVHYTVFCYVCIVQPFDLTVGMLKFPSLLSLA